MGATGSRSSPPTETFLVTTIPEYSKLRRVPGGLPKVKVDKIFFHDLYWVLNIFAHEDDWLFVELRPQDENPVVVGLGMSIEILDETGEHTVFHQESSRRTSEEKRGKLWLTVRESALKASSCVRRRDESITIRCTLKEQPKTKRGRRLFRNWPSSKSEKQQQQQQLPAAVSEAASHTLTVGSLSELKATLPSGLSAYSTRFAVGGSSWQLAFCPTHAVVRLLRPSKDDDETRTTAEFSFALQGAVNVESGKMRHTFDRASRYYQFAYQPPEEPSASSTDRLVVRCCVQVIPAAVVPTTVPVPESVLTPLLSAIAMHG